MSTELTSEGFNDLPHISEALPLTDEDDQLVADLHEVLKKHGALDRFGITLLHNHFHISDDEVLVEDTDMETRVQTISPVPISELADVPIVQTAWHLKTGKAVMSCTCVKSGNDHSHQHRPCDIALKEDVHPLENVLQRIRQIEPTTFRYRSDANAGVSLPKGAQVGFIAQNVETVAPELVTDNGTHKSVDFVGMIPMLLQSIKELDQKVTKLMAERNAS